MYCETGSEMCIMSCPGGNCKLHCDGSKCKRDCSGGGCELSGTGVEVEKPKPPVKPPPVKPKGTASGVMPVALSLFVPVIANILTVYEY